MARKKGRNISPKIEGDLLANVMRTTKPKEARKSLLAQRGMIVRRKEALSKICYICKAEGSFDNQLIPRWISKETMVCVCFGCYERSVGWVKVDNAVKITDFNIGKDFVSLTGALQQLEWQAQTEATLIKKNR